MSTPHKRQKVSTGYKPRAHDDDIFNMAARDVQRSGAVRRNNEQEPEVEGKFFNLFAGLTASVFPQNTAAAFLGNFLVKQAADRESDNAARTQPPVVPTPPPPAPASQREYNSFWSLGLAKIPLPEEVADQCDDHGTPASPPQTLGSRKFHGDKEVFSTVRETRQIQSRPQIFEIPNGITWSTSFPATKHNEVVFTMEKERIGLFSYFSKMPASFGWTYKIDRRKNSKGMVKDKHKQVLTQKESPFYHWATAQLKDRDEGLDMSHYRLKNIKVDGKKLHFHPDHTDENIVQEVDRLLSHGIKLELFYVRDDEHIPPAHQHHKTQHHNKQNMHHVQKKQMHDQQAFKPLPAASPYDSLWG